MDGWKNILSLSDHWEGGQLWMQAHPGSPEELVENVVLLTITVEEPTADHMGPEHGVMLRKGNGLKLEKLQLLELG